MDEEPRWPLLAEIAKRHGWDRRTLRRRLKKAGVAPRLDPLDHRRRVISAEDYERLMEPVPVDRKEEAPMGLG